MVHPNAPSVDGLRLWTFTAIKLEWPLTGPRKKIHHICCFWLFVKETIFSALLILTPHVLDKVSLQWPPDNISQKCTFYIINVGLLEILSYEITVHSFSLYHNVCCLIIRVLVLGGLCCFKYRPFIVNNLAGLLSSVTNALDFTFSTSPVVAHLINAFFNIQMKLFLTNNRLLKSNLWPSNARSCPSETLKSLELSSLL